MGGRNMRWKLFLVCFLFLGVVYAVNANAVSAESGNTNLTYSGYLTSGGTPLTWSYAMTFRLCDVESGETALSGYVTTVGVVDLLHC